jgi:hypothetical protein
MIVVAAGAVAVGAWLLGVRHRPAQRIKHSRADEPKAPRTSKPKRRSSGRGRRL